MTDTKPSAQDEASALYGELLSSLIRKDRRSEECVTECVGKIRDALAAARAEGERAGREAERADVLRWMRADWDGDETHVARRIERGDHLK